VTSVTLDDRAAGSISTEGDRWSASFSNVPPGAYTLRVTADDGSTDQEPIQIEATK
jgi:hypothetical protein